MTKNQIEYLKMRETQRANLRNEELTQARDRTARDLGFATLGETNRHNVETEKHNVRILGENTRHNLAVEEHNRQVLGETQRHNYAQEAHNTAVLGESTRHNLAIELLQGKQVEASVRQVDENMRHNKATEVETSRSNLAREAEIYRSNVAQETETARRNRRSEEQRADELALSYANLSETSRYHDISIGLGYSQLAETRRANQAREDETFRSNVAFETENRRSHLAQEQERIRSAIAQENQKRLDSQRNYNLGVQQNTERRRSALASEGLRQQEIDIRNREADIDQARLGETTRHNKESEWQDFLRNATSGARYLIPLFGG